MSDAYRNLPVHNIYGDEIGWVGQKVEGTRGPKEGMKGKLLTAGYAQSWVKWSDKTASCYPHRSLRFVK